MKELMRHDRDLPMDFADAALVRVAERDGIKRVLSFDNHFRVYRLPKRVGLSSFPDGVDFCAHSNEPSTRVCPTPGDGACNTCAARAGYRREIRRASGLTSHE